MGWCYRHSRAVVAVDQDMAVRLGEYGVRAQVVAPWVFTTVIEQVSRANAEAEEPWTWIYSGNLGRAHDWETLLAAQAILEKRGAGIRLIFQGGGPARPGAEAKAVELGLRECVWKGYADETELPNTLRRAQVLVATQLPAAQGLLWPSKMALIRALPRTILWVGPTDGAIAQELRALSPVGIFAPGEAEAVADWLIGRKSAAESRVAMDPAAARKAALNNWQEIVERA
jgi:glycosyltransferase involved in cell wall biosynthesis